jgi:hypothetical protein
MVGKAIRAQINDLEGLMFDDDNDDEDIPEDLDKVESNVFVGSKRRAITFSALEAEMEKDTAFHNFRTRFSRYLSHFLQVYEYGLPEGKLVNLQPHNEVIYHSNSRKSRTELNIDYSLPVSQSFL